MTNSKRKGAKGERELSSKLREYGFNTRRGQQYCGANGDADVVGLHGVHIECKRVQKLNLYDAMAQAKSDAKEGEIPTVFHRKDRCEWLVTMRLDDYMKMYKTYYENLKEGD
jgi:Holliday junction resolvase